MNIKPSKKYLAMSIIFFLKMIAASAQSVDIYNDHLPEVIEKRNTKGVVRLLHDSIIVQDEVRIGKYKRLEKSSDGKTVVSDVFYLKNGKPIGDVFVKNEKKGIAVIYSNKDGREVTVKFSNKMDEYSRLLFFINYFISNKFL